MSYQAVLISTDGKDFVLDFESETVERVWDHVSDMGSWWYFYPYVFVISASNTVNELTPIVDVPHELLRDDIGSSLGEVMVDIEDRAELYAELLLS